MTATGFDSWPFTVAHFIVMGVFAVLVIIGILWGMKLKRRRLQAEEDFDAHREAAEAPLAGGSEDDTPVGQVEAPARAIEPESVPVPVSPPAPTAPVVEDIPAAVSAPATATPTGADIRQMKGLGPKLAATLEDLGVTRVDQIAAMSPTELDALDARLGAFKGRPARDRWAEQARLLTSGDRAAYEAEFGKLGG